MSIDEFDKENNIVDLNDDLKAEEQKRLDEVEAEIMEDNEKYAKGEASSGMKLYPWSDESKDEIEAEKMGLSREWDPSRGDAPPERAMGLIMPPETERINSPQEELDSLYETDRGYAPRTYFAVNDGKFLLWQMIFSPFFICKFFRTCYCCKESGKLWILCCLCSLWPT